MSQKILIVSRTCDMHELAVHYYLRTIGIPVASIYTDELVSHAKSSLRLASSVFKWCYRDDHDEVDLASISTVWLRRVAKTAIPEKELHAGDLDMARREVNEYACRFLVAICRDARWVNPIDLTPYSSSKFAQLIEARAAGLSIPETLISNDPAEIRAFLSGPESIYKSMAPMRWFESGRAYAMATSKAELDQLPPDRLLQIVPGIFQRRIHKRSDIRVVFMGAAHVAIRMPADENPSGSLDVREVDARQLRAHVYTLPHDVERRCRKLMRLFNMEYGCFDFVETLEGELVFLEINPGGQFLWMEMVVPEIRAFAKFIAFLTGAQSLPEVSFPEFASRPDFVEWRMKRADLPA